jgi:isopenicillin-N epimerase
VTDRTRLVIVDQVTSSTARRMPLVSLLPALKERGAPVFVDGAHAAGMLAVDLDRMGADYWAGNLHKWCCAPRGTAVLHVAPEHRHRACGPSSRRGEPAAFPIVQRRGDRGPHGLAGAPRALRLLDQLGYDRLRRLKRQLAVHNGGARRTTGPRRTTLPRDPAVSMQLGRCPPGWRAPLKRDGARALIGSRSPGGGRDQLAGTGSLRLSAHAYNSPAAMPGSRPTCRPAPEGPSGPCCHAVR